jgi:sialidase-1
LPAETGQFLLTRSDDDGLTWSAPINITSQIKKPEWRLLLQGPGAGIQLRDGTLVFPAQHRDANGRAHAFFIFSKDGGNTWASSAIIDGPDVPETTEAQMAELSDGRLLITLRNHAGKGLRAWSRWEWSGALAHGSWSPLTYANEDPVCQASLIRANDEVLVFANPASATIRSALSLRFSRDDGRSWSAPRVLDPRPAAYSSMTILRDGSVGILYECGDAFAADTLTFA